MRETLHRSAAAAGFGDFFSVIWVSIGTKEVNVYSRLSLLVFLGHRQNINAFVSVQATVWLFSAAAFWMLSACDEVYERVRALSLK